jgi:hypothetical protein
VYLLIILEFGLTGEPIVDWGVGEAHNQMGGNSQMDSHYVPHTLTTLSATTTITNEITFDQIWKVCKVCTFA